MYRQRQLATALRQALAGFPAVLVTGPRQSGKTTFLRHEAGEHADHVSFDDPLEREFATVDPVGFLARFAKRPVILDEIQYVPSLLSHVKMRIDAEPRRCGHWLLTGSQQFGLMRDVDESLAGRVAILELPPFSYPELPRTDLGTLLWNGGYPVPGLHPDRRDLWLRGYVSTYIERDVRQIRNIPDLRSFNQFPQPGGHTAWAGIPRRRPGPRARHQPAHREILGRRTRGLLYRALPATLVSQLWQTRGQDAQVLFPRFRPRHTADPPAGCRRRTGRGRWAERCWKAGWSREAINAFMALGRKPDVYYWRSHDGLEVDLLIVIDGKLQAVEVKLTATPGAGHLEPLRRFLAVAGDDAAGSGLIVCRCAKEQAMPNGHLAMPWKSFPAWLQAKLAKAEKV